MPGSHPSRFFRSEAVISSAEMVRSAMGYSSSGQEDIAERFELRGHLAVDHGVAHPGDDPADDGGVHDRAHLHFRAGDTAQGGGEAFDGGFVERDGGADLG